MRSKRAVFVGICVGALSLVAEVAVGQTQPQQPPKEPPPTQKESTQSPSERRRPTTAPAPFKPAEKVSPSRKLSYPNDI